MTLGLIILSSSLFLLGALLVSVLVDRGGDR